MLVDEDHVAELEKEELNREEPLDGEVCLVPLGSKICCAKTGVLLSNEEMSATRKREVNTMGEFKVVAR